MADQAIVKQEAADHEITDQKATGQEATEQKRNDQVPSGLLDEEVPRTDYPEEWLRLTTREDGGRKPTILYYVDVSPLFTDAEKTLRKIRDVLRIFEENRDQVTVLWRHDRMIDHDLKSDAPEIWQQYHELEDRFAQDGYGILDDTVKEDEAYFRMIREDYPGPGPTPGEQRAIDFCKAFYGSPGYLANCFRNAGKPVMLQNTEILSGEG